MVWYQTNRGGEAVPKAAGPPLAARGKKARKKRPGYNLDTRYEMKTRNSVSAAHAGGPAIYITGASPRSKTSPKAAA